MVALGAFSNIKNPYFCSGFTRNLRYASQNSNRIFHYCVLNGVSWTNQSQNIGRLSSTVKFEKHSPSSFLYIEMNRSSNDHLDRGERHLRKRENVCMIGRKTMLIETWWRGIYTRWREKMKHFSRMNKWEQSLCGHWNSTHTNSMQTPGSMLLYPQFIRKLR